MDRLRVKDNDVQRLRSTVDEALRQGGKQMMVIDMETNHVRHYSQLLMDSETGISYPEPAPHNFSFNSPQGYCPRCKGLGLVNVVDEEKVMPDKSLSIYEGGISPLGKYKNSLIFWQIEAICKLYGKTIKTPIKELPYEALDDILNGTDQKLDIQNATMSTAYFPGNYDGLVKYIEMQQSEDAGNAANKWSGQFFRKKRVRNVRGSD